MQNQKALAAHWAWKKQST